MNEKQKEQLLNEVLSFEENICKKYKIDSRALQNYKREYFLKNNAFKFEFDKLESTLQNLQKLNPLLYKKIYHTGMLFQYLASELYSQTKEEYYIATTEYVLAAYYANFGYLAIENSIYKENYTTKEDLQIIKRHVKISADLLDSKGLKRIAEIVKLHHEKPNGAGYLKVQNTSDRLLGLLNIADEFIDCIVPSKKPEMTLVLEEAIEEASKGYETSLLIDAKHLLLIKDILIKYYNEKMSV